MKNCISVGRLDTNGKGSNNFSCFYLSYLLFLTIFVCFEKLSGYNRIQSLSKISDEFCIIVQ